MNNIWKLFKGEIVRLFLYKVVFFAVLVSKIWVLIIALLSASEVKTLLPFVVVMDSGLMSIILLGPMFYYEKQEGIAKSLLVAPISVAEILIAKVGASIFNGFISIILVFLATMIFHGIVFNIFLATVYMIIAVIAHTALGYLIILASKDFMAMLIKYMGLVLLLVAPSIMLILNVIPSNLSFLAIVSPVYASQLLINSIFQSTDLWQIILAFAWLLLIGGILYPFVIKKQYQRYAMGN